MILLIAFAFFAGVVTVLSPCILPILPIILSSSIGGKEMGKSRPLGVVTGFALSFTFFTLFLSTIVRVAGVSAETLRFLSILVLAGFGFSLLIPKFQEIIEQLFSGLTKLSPSSQNKTGFGGGLIIGLSIGLLWTPCVGPILASVISLAITGTVTFEALLITLAYSLGTSIPMFLIIIGGQNTLRRVPWLLSNLSRVQKAFGVVMILTAIGIFFNIDRKVQTWVLGVFPQYGSGLIKIEDNELVRKQLEKKSESLIENKDLGKPSLDLLEAKGVKAPELIPGGVWLNSKPLTLAQLKGKVVVIDFWTYSCINCQRTLPYLKDWYKKYQDKGLVIIGVHAPEFEFEKSEKNLTQAVAEFGLSYPIVQDNAFATWRAYNNHYWPAKYFIDKDGFVRYSHFGEGDYDESEKVIQNLLEEAGAENISTAVNNPSYKVMAKTPETYLGYGRMEGLASKERVERDEPTQYSAPAKLGINQVAFDGEWTVMSEYASPQKGANLLLNFEAKEVYLVMRKKTSPAKIKVYLDDQLQNFGEDNLDGMVTVERDRLYQLINLPTSGRHLLRLEFEDSEAELFAFTFG